MTQDTPRTLAVRFTGSGSEYFRIWIVNLLLIIVTLGFYLPFAKVRRLRYFYGNTVVDDQPLAFHGQPWAMFRGHVLLLVLFGLYAVAGQVSPVAALVAFVILAAIWPALWRAGLAFRLANTSWRGLRFAFRGDLLGAYATLAPMGLGVALMLAGPAWMGAPTQAQPLAPGVTVVFAGMAITLLTLPWVLARIKRYQHDHYAWAGEQTRFGAGPGAFYGWALKLLGMATLAMVALGGAVAGVVFGSGQDAKGPWLIYGPVVLIFVFYGVMGLLLYPWGIVRLQNMVWNATTSDQLRFDSRLALGATVRLHAVNIVLTLLTLGLYRPFAAVSMARLRLEAVTVQAQTDPATWQVGAGTAGADAAGEAAGDFFGFDLGL